MFFSSEGFKCLKFYFCTDSSAGLACLLPKSFWDPEIKCSCSLALVQMSLMLIIGSEFSTKCSSHGYGTLITKTVYEPQRKYGKDMELVVENKSENCQGKRQAEWESKAMGKTLERANRSVKGTES